MSSFWKKAMIWLGLEDEEPVGDLVHTEGTGAPGGGLPGVYEVPQGGSGGPEAGFQEANQPAEMAAVGVRTDQPAAVGHVASTYTPSSAETAGFEAGSGVRMLPASDSRVHVIEPQGFADAQEIGERFRQAQPVIVDLGDVERDTARRIVDFASGLTFALRGRMKKVADHVFLLLPAHASIPDDEKDRLRASGYDV